MTKDYFNGKEIARRQWDAWRAVMASPARAVPVVKALISSFPLNELRLWSELFDNYDAPERQIFRIQEEIFHQCSAIEREPQVFEIYIRKSGGGRALEMLNELPSDYR